MLSIAELAASAVPFLTVCFSDTASAAIDASKKAVGEKIANWLIDKLKGSTDEAVIQKLKTAPDSASCRRSAEGAVLSLLEENPSLATELAEILKSAGPDDHSIRQKAATKGDNSTITQIVGSNNKVGR